MAKGDMTIVLNKAEYERLVNTLDKAADVDTSPAVQKGLRDGAKAMQNAGKSNLASRNGTYRGNLKRSFRIKVTKRKKIGSNYALSGFKRSSRFNKVDGAGNHAHLIDRGTAKRWRKDGRYTGSISKGNPHTGTKFWTDAVDSEGPKALKNMVNIIENELDKIMG